MRPDRRRSRHKVSPAEKENPAAGTQVRTRSSQLIQTKAQAKRKSLKIPALLLEGDTATIPSPTGPGERFVLSPRGTPPHLQPVEQSGELPEAYGTQKLFLIARDPHWLYAHWDLTREHLREYNALSADRHLVLRVYVNAISEQPLTEIHVHPESRNWFIHVERGGAKYLAELGYYERTGRKWITILVSKAMPTPPDELSPDIATHFAMIPFGDSFQKLTETVKAAVDAGVPLAEAIEQLSVPGDSQRTRANIPPAQLVPTAEEALGPTGELSPDTTAPFATIPFELSIEELIAMIKESDGTNTQSEALEELLISHNPGLPHNILAPGEWSAAQKEAFAQVGAMDRAPRAGIAPLEITELIRRKLMPEISSTGAAEFSLPTSPRSAFSTVSSPVSIAERKSDFWFNVNAELVVYGATEPDATVSIGGRMIKLRPDGSFSYRFALPDGAHELPVIAVSANQTGSRAAELRFHRRTEYRGDVSAHPQDPSLRTPSSAAHAG